MCKVKFINDNIYIAYSTLTDEYNISEGALKVWSTRNIGERIYSNNRAYISYDSIPAPTRKKLPTKEELIAKYHATQHDEVTERFFLRMEYAHNKGFVKYRDLYRNLGVKFDEITSYAQHHAVWEIVLDLHKQDRKPKLRNIWEAYCRLYQDRFAYNRMNYAINKAKTEGIENLLIYKCQGTEKKYNALYDKWILDALSSGKAYSQHQIHTFVGDLCQQYNYEAPSLSWVKRKCKELEPVVYASRYGNDKEQYGKLPYKGILRAEQANDQWQIDGWRLPFYMKDYKNLTLFWVLDACTGKIVGYEIAETEQTETILKGLEEAVSSTNCLPFEIVSDNHSFNKTKEAEYFKDNIKKLGTTWTVSENPRHKSFVERSFKSFGEKFCKQEYGYIGEGIRTRNKNGRTSQEMMDKCTKADTFLTQEQITLIAIKCVEAYNNEIGKDGKSRIQRYAESPAANAIQINKADYLRLFIRETEVTIRRGQANITRGSIQYEYQLTAAQYQILNDKKVRVRYESFDEIYLFDMETDEFIDTVKRKQYAHGALANQTEEDTKQYFQHKGRLNGIKSNKKKSQVEIARQAENIDPYAAYAMNAKLTPKNIVEEYEANGHLREEAERRGIDLGTVTNMKVASEVKTYDPEPDKKTVKRKEHPFSVTEKERQEFKIEDYIIED